MINIPGYLLGAIIFLVGQTSAAIWWASGISNDVEMLKQDRDEMAEIIEHLDVLLQQLRPSNKPLALLKNDPSLIRFSGYRVAFGPRLNRIIGRKHLHRQTGR